MAAIPDVLAHMASARYFTILDLSKGYFQVPVAEGDKDKTSFSCHRGLWKFRTMHMGFAGAPASFQRLMDSVLHGCKWQYAMAFLDDLVVFSNTFQDHLKHLEDVLSRLQRAGLTINPAKIQLCVEDMSLLGYQLSPGKCQPDPAKVAEIRNFPAPRNVKELQRFLGMIGFYRSFVPSFAEVAKPLHKLLRKETVWTWEVEQQTVMNTLIDWLEAQVFLALPDLNKPFVIQVDASENGLGAILLQEADGQLCPVASRTLTKPEANYSATEVEALAMDYVLKKFRMSSLKQTTRL